jgi:biopolymer transport protein ExbB/TolQ
VGPTGAGVFITERSARATRTGVGAKAGRSAPRASATAARNAALRAGLMWRSANAIASRLPRRGVTDDADRPPETDGRRSVPVTTPFADLLHAISQLLLAPVLAALLVSLLYVVYQAGVFCTEWWAHRGLARAPAGTIPTGAFGARLRRLEGDAIAVAGAEDAESLAERLLAAEELALARRVERTDLLVRLGPALGLVGTLIPLGPGLAALGRGEVQLLAGALTVAFDATIVGLLVGGAAFVISSVRRRWYEGFLQRAAAHLEDRINAERAVTP